MKITNYKVFVEQLSLAIKLGCMPEERVNYQVAVLDLEFELKVNQKNFELDKTVCYLTASNLARELAAKDEWDLIENFLSALGTKLFERFNSAERIKAKLRKFVVPNAQSAGAQIEFVREI